MGKQSIQFRHWRIISLPQTKLKIVNYFANCYWMWSRVFLDQRVCLWNKIPIKFTSSNKHTEHERLFLWMWISYGENKCSKILRFSKCVTVDMLVVGPAQPSFLFCLFAAIISVLIIGFHSWVILFMFSFIWLFCSMHGQIAQSKVIVFTMHSINKNDQM